MSRLAPQHHVPLHVLYDRMTDKRLAIHRCSVAASNAVKSADNLVNGELRRYGHECKRVMLVFVDDHKEPDRLACVVFSLAGGFSLVVDVDVKGNFGYKTLYAVETSRRLPEKLMYEFAGITPPSTYDAEHEKYATRVYARNRTCYK